VPIEEEEEQQQQEQEEQEEDDEKVQLCKKRINAAEHNFAIFTFVDNFL